MATSLLSFDYKPLINGISIVSSSNPAFSPYTNTFMLCASSMRANFKIDNNSAVLYNGQIVDLHNNFDFVGMTEDIQNKEINLHFVKSEGNWVRSDEFAQLTFSLKNISYKYEEEGELGDYPNDANCLGEITFFPSEYRDVNDSIMQQSEPKENDDLMFFFEDGKVIRVHCEEAELILNQ